MNETILLTSDLYGTSPAIEIFCLEIMIFDCLAYEISIRGNILGDKSNLKIYDE